MSCMSVGRSLYRLYDSDPTRGCHRVGSFDEAWKWSEQNWGIFWTVNQFEGERKKENLKKILAFAVDLDGGDKPAMLDRIRKFLKPSAVIETKNGYHVYYDAIGATPEGYEAIVGERLVPLLGGDPKAKDVSRILRVPAFMHWKDLKNPFAVKMVFSSDAVYSEEHMRQGFALPEAPERVSTERYALRQALKFQSDESLFARVYSLDCEQALIRISGQACVNHEMFSFRRVSSGNKNILVNGNPTSCWVDKNGRIGSSDGGGPTIWQWINWYQRDHKKTYEAFKQHFPEVIRS